MKSKKLIIIGGGIAGLTAGVYALKSGFQAEIYEKRNTVGGQCTGWDRRDYHIDNCIHSLIGIKKGTSLNKIWRDIGALGDDVEVFSSEKLYTSELNGEKITLWKDVDRTEKEMIALSPEDEKEIRKLMTYVRIAKSIQIPANKPGDMMNILDYTKMVIFKRDILKIYKEYSNKDIKDLAEKFKHPLIKCMLSDFVTQESLAKNFILAYGNFISEDGGIPKGGSRSMAFRIKEKFESLGGKVYTNTPATKVVIENGEKAKGIMLPDGRVVSGDYIICACDTNYTFTHLIDKSFMPFELKEMYENKKSYPVCGTFQAAFSVDSSLDLLGGEVVIDCSSIKQESWMGDRMTVKTYAYEESFAPKGKNIIQVLVGLHEEAYDYWKELYNNKENYLSKKREIARNIIKLLEEKFPAYKGKIKMLDTWTPVTYNRYCNAYKGYYQSFMITKAGNGKSISGEIEEIDNVFLTGQWINTQGGLPTAAIQGKFTIQRILRKERRFINI